MVSNDLEEINSLFKESERTLDPEQKIKKFKDAINQIKELLGGSATPDESIRLRLENIKSAYTRALLNALPSLMQIPLDVWIVYFIVLVSMVGPEVDVLLEKDPGLKAGYDEFIGLWIDTLREHAVTLK